jgi:hypothetical protein
MDEDGEDGEDGGAGRNGDGHGPAADDEERIPRERAKRIATRLRFLRMRERTANFEDREAIRREIRRTEEELSRLADAGGFDVDVGVRRDR